MKVITVKSLFNLVDMRIFYLLEIIAFRLPVLWALSNLYIIKVQAEKNKIYIKLYNKLICLSLGWEMFDF